MKFFSKILVAFIGIPFLFTACGGSTNDGGDSSEGSDPAIPEVTYIIGNFKVNVDEFYNKTIVGVVDNDATSLVVPNDITNIYKGAFKECRKVQSLTVPFVGGSATSNRFLAYVFGADSYEHSFGPDLYGHLRQVIITDGCDSIGDFAFFECDNITSITLPDSIKTIGNGAFYSCDLLSSITIPNNVSSIGIRAFALCEKITQINIPNSVTSIGKGAFEDCSSLETVNFNCSVTSLEELIFSGCGALTNIRILDSGVYHPIAIPDTVTSIGKQAFQFCHSLYDTIEIPTSVVSIDDGAFALTSLHFIEYKGNMAQWKNIKLSSNWNVQSDIEKIECTDGVIKIFKR